MSLKHIAAWCLACLIAAPIFWPHSQSLGLMFWMLGCGAFMGAAAVRKRG